MTEFERREHNDRVLDMWRAGESLAVITTTDAWFPPRPIIKKIATPLCIEVTEAKRVIDFRKK